MRTLLANRTRGLWPLLCALSLLAAVPAGAANIVILNNNAPGVGFNDPSPRSPVGGNPGTTLGAQRLFVFNHAAAIWGGILPSGVTIVVRAQFAAQSCTPTSAVLGSAGAVTIHRDFAGAPFAGTWYNQALANRLFGSDLSAAQPDINATFNLSIDTGCFGPGLVWYYGIDGLEGSNIELLPVVLHEIGHGLGFQTFTSGTTGAYNSGFPSISDRFLFDTVNNLHWHENTAAQRVASAVSIDKLAWDGAAVNKEAVDFLGPRPVLRINSPAGIAGTYPVQTASFGGPVTLAGLTGNVVLGDDGVAPVNDGCEPLVNAGAVAGNIVLLDRGLCTFVVKAQQAQAAGAVGLLVANNAAGLPGMGGTDPSITIPCVGITQAEGNAIKANLAGGVNVTIHLDPTLKAGSDSNGRVLMYAPNPFASGSSVSHYDVSLTPNALMEPSINNSLHDDLDLTPFHFRDLGWFPTTTLDLAASSTTVDCSDSLVLTATVSPPGGAKGTVEFFEGANSIGVVPVVDNTTATLSLSPTPGSYSFTSSYTCFTCSTATTSNKVTVDVDLTPISTTTTLTAEPSPSGCGQDVTFAATVSPAPPPGGTVNFFDGGNPIGSAPIVGGGVATITLSTLAVGSHSITAVFKGDSCFLGSTSDPVAHDVVLNQMAVALSSDMNPSTCGAKVNLTARIIEPAPPGLLAMRAGGIAANRAMVPPSPTGTVNFFDNGVPIGSAPVTDSVATLSVTDLTVGLHPITAVYKGDTCYASASSDTLHQVVSPAPTTLVLASSPNPSDCGQKVTLTATVDPAAATGTVTFVDGITPIGSAPVVNGVATLSVTTFSAGNHSLTAEYSGDTCYASSLADKIVHVVNPTGSSVSLSVDHNPGKAGDVFVFTAAISPSGSTGTVQFYDGADSLGSSPVVSDTASLATKLADEGLHSITAVFSGDDCKTGSTSNKVEVQVGAAPVLSITDTTRTEGETGTINMTFRVRLSTPSTNTVTVDYHTENGTATAGVDYVAQAGTVTFPPGSNQQLIQIPLIPNNTQQSNRDFRVVLTNPVKATIGDSVGVGTILDDDTPTIVINNVSRNEDALVPTFTFTVSLNHGVSHPVTVDFTTADNTATVANNDYEALNGTLSFAPKETSKPITVTVNADSIREADNVTPWENFQVLLSNATGATIADGLGVGTIQDDDSAPQIYVDDAQANEEDGTVTFRIRLQGASAVQQVRVNYTTLDGTATAPPDYVATSGQVTFAFKEREKFVTVVVNDDIECEQNQVSQFETFFLRLSNPRGGNIFDNTGQATIRDTMDCRVVPSTLSQFSANWVTGGIELRWQFATPGEFVETSMERSASSSGPWSLVAATIRNEDGVQVAVDGSVDAGSTYWYRLIGRNGSGERTVFGPLSATAGRFTGEFALAGIWPNPARGFARIDYVVPRQANVRLSIVDVLGREVMLLESGTKSAGSYQATWNGQTDRGQAPVGLYFVRYQADRETQFKRVVLTR